MIYARSIVVPEPSKSAYLPYDNAAEQYPEFNNDDFPMGISWRFTCEESKLGNYFGANPDAPHYLTPVFFKPAVLENIAESTIECPKKRLQCDSQWASRLTI